MDQHSAGATIFGFSLVAIAFGFFVLSAILPGSFLYRAKSVITFLVQQGNVPIRHIVAPGAMGEYGAKAPNETKAGRAENRRVEVKVLVNKGIAGS